MLEPRTVFASDGPLARELDGYAYRESQATMAALVWDALGQGRTLAVEAGTGIGKTFAYLVPVLLAGQRAVISTGTKTLQDQLYGRDLPALAGAIGRPVTVALLKGRGNYLCWHRLALAQRGDFGTAPDLGGLGALERWGRVSDSGDLNDYTDLSDGFARKSWVTSTADNCLGTDCDWLEDCFVVKARRGALGADVVVVNHHLLLADLALKDAGFGELLPGAEAIVVDEAHLLPEIAQYFFGVSVGTRELDGLRSDVIAEARSAGLADALEPLADRLGRVVAEARMRAALLDGRTPWTAAPAALRQRVDGWHEILNTLTEALVGVADGSAGLARAHERCVELGARLTTLAEPDGDGLRWLEPGERSLAVHWTPLDTGRALGERIRMHGGTWIFASATLAVGDDFDHFVGRVGVDDADTAVLPSPFDYERTARMYLPEGLPAPSAPDFTATLLSHIWPLIEAAHGGAFLLFTSYRALGEAERWLTGRVLPGPLLVQGQGGRTELLEQFRAAGDAVLLGTSSFWQGVDVRGEALRIVVIDKLPFASPGDPLIGARLAGIRAAGGNPFTEFQLPQAVLTLKQGVGRLIRDFDDRGLIVIGDPRIRRSSYGRVFVESLPAMPVLESLDDALAFAADLEPATSQPTAAATVGGPS